MLIPRGYYDYSSSSVGVNELTAYGSGVLVIAPREGASTDGRSLSISS